MIQWFPGHMAKAFKQIQEKSVIADLFIVVLDARAPLSTYNEDFDKIAPNKPRLFVITKQDLGHKNKIETIVKSFNHKSDGVLVVNLKKTSVSKVILKEAERLLKSKRERDLKKGLLKPRLRAIVIGVPNSGKSTLINAIAKKAATKVGNKPGVTKGQQWINANEIQLLDTPGILWPKFNDELVGVKLAVIGSIKSEIIPQRELFNQGYKLLSKYYPDKLRKINLIPTNIDTEIYNNLVDLCIEKKFLQAKKSPNIKKGMTWFINYLRDLKGVTYD